MDLEKIAPGHALYILSMPYSTRTESSIVNSSTLGVIGVAAAPVGGLEVRRTSRWFERTNPWSNPTENDRVTTIFRQNAVFRHLDVNAVRQYCNRYVTSHHSKFFAYSTTIRSIVHKNGRHQEEMLDGNRGNSDATRPYRMRNCRALVRNVRENHAQIRYFSIITTGNNAKLRHKFN
jgi:hypothetical protein